MAPSDRYDPASTIATLTVELHSNNHVMHGIDGGNYVIGTDEGDGAQCIRCGAWFNGDTRARMLTLAGHYRDRHVAEGVQDDLCEHDWFEYASYRQCRACGRFEGMHRGEWVRIDSRGFATP